MGATKEITVLLATRDRARSMLGGTLERFCKLDRVGLDVEFLIVDNGSQDETQRVLASFQDRLPLRTLFVEQPGKCHALNRALDGGSLGDIVVFTDDDVAPGIEWLRAIRASTERWPACGAFGGKIRPLWPEGVLLPDWIQEEWIRGVGYAEHDHGPEERLYPPEVFPLGPNFWLRSSVLESGIRFDERIGARPRNRTMGEEIDFLGRVRAAGHDIVYVPSAEVGHRIERAAISRAWLARRAVRYGRGIARIRPLCHPRLLERFPLAWYARRALAILRQSARLLASRFRLSRRKQIVQSLEAITWLTYNQESMRRAWKQKRPSRG